VSVGDGGWQANGASSEPSISADGRYVTFSSYASNLVANDTIAVGDVFVRDMQLGKTERVSVRSGGNQALGGDSELSSVSADGRYIAFASRATNLAARDANGMYDVFLRDRTLDTTTLLSRTLAGTAGNNLSNYPSISANGTAVAYETLSTDVFPRDANVGFDVVVFNVLTGQNILASKNSEGVQSNGNSQLIGTRQNVSADGRLVAFSSKGTNMLPHDQNGPGEDIFVHDRFSGVTKQVSVHSTGQSSNGGNSNTAISADGRHVAFMSWASNLVPGDTNGTTDIIVRSPWLTLSPEETSVVPGQTLRLTTWRGSPNGTMVFGISSIEGYPYLLPIVTWKFNPLGNVEFKTIVPVIPLLQGLDVGFRSGGLTPAGTIDVTQEVVVSFE
jgi:Tol biopolymer transport system component